MNPKPHAQEAKNATLRRSAEVLVKEWSQIATAQLPFQG
jgi:hypothetical protein